MADDTREKLRADIQVAEPKELLPHQRRDALIMVHKEVDILDVAMAVAQDEADTVASLLEEKKLFKPTLGELADWCVDQNLRVQFVILQPYVLAQLLDPPKATLS